MTPIEQIIEQLTKAELVAGMTANDVRAAHSTSCTHEEHMLELALHDLVQRSRKLQTDLSDLRDRFARRGRYEITDKHTSTAGG